MASQHQSANHNNRCFAMATPNQQVIDELVAIADTTPPLTIEARRAKLLSGLPNTLKLLCKQDGDELPDISPADMEKAVDSTLTLLAKATSATEHNDVLDVFMTLMGVGLGGRHLSQMIGYVLLASATVDSPENNAELECKAAAIECLREHGEQQQHQAAQAAN
jgi:hypothetical protein